MTQLSRTWWALVLFLIAGGVIGAEINASGEPNFGIRCLLEDNGKIIARHDYFPQAYFQSATGVEWEKTDGPQFRCTTVRSGLEVPDPMDPAIRYRLHRGAGVFRSTDEGQSWLLDFDVAARRNLDTELKRVYHEQVYLGHPNASETGLPGDMLVQQTSGRVIVAMGFGGVAVRLEDGTWQEVAVNGFRPLPTTQAGYLDLLMPQHLLVAIALMIVPFSIWGGRITGLFKAAAPPLVPLFLFGVTPLFVSVLFALRMDSLWVSTWTATLAIFVTALPAAFVVSRTFRTHRIRPVLLVAGLCIAMSAGFILPFVWWVSGGGLSLDAAARISALLTVLVIPAGTLFMQRKGVWSS